MQNELINKYSKPIEANEKDRISVVVSDQFNAMPKLTGTVRVLNIDDIIREKEDDLLNLDATNELISNPENLLITRLSFNYL